MDSHGVIFILCLVLTHNLQVRAVSKRQIIAEWIVEKVTKLVNENMGLKFDYFCPFICAIISLSAFSSLSSLVGMYPPTADLNTVAGWAILVFVLITYYKIKTNGFLGYLKGYTEPFALFTPFNVLSELGTPVSMAFRHFGNVVSGTVISALVYAALAGLSTVLLGWLPGHTRQDTVFADRRSGGAFGILRRVQLVYAGVHLRYADDAVHWRSGKHGGLSFKLSFQILDLGFKLS